MNGKFNEQKEALEALLHEIKLLGRQIVYLLRNEQEVDLLDIDVMLRRTHTIYDQICAFEPLPDEEFDWDELKESANLANLERSANLANLTNLEEEEAEEEVLEEKTEEKEEEHIEEKSEEKEEKEEKEEAEEVTDFGFIFRPEEPKPVVQEEEIKEEIEEEAKEQIEEEAKEQIEEETKEEANDETLAFDFNISAGEIEEPDIHETPETEKEVYTTGDQIEMVIPHIDNTLFETQDEETEEEIQEEEIPEEAIPEEETEEETEEEIPEEENTFEEEIAEASNFEEDTAEENHFEEDTAEEMTFEEHKDEAPAQEEIVEEESPEQDESYPYEPILFGDMEEKEEAGFEIIQEILGEKLQAEDHSLAAKLQHKPVKDLKTAIGINDKFLLVNELFGGSMERYNKSIENLNDLPTLDGAIGYLDELYVEYQWNRNNEAYKKLMDLVHRKFEN